MPPKRLIRRTQPDQKRPRVESSEDTNVDALTRLTQERERRNRQTNNDIEATGLSRILEPLLTRNKVTVNNLPLSEEKVKENSNYRNFLLNSRKRNPIYTQLAEFNSRQLADLEDNPNVPRKFGSFSLNDRAQETRLGQSADTYNSRTRSINLSPNSGEGAPIIPFTHETTHALDDLFMKIPEREGIDFLAKMEKQSPNIDYLQNPKWYRQAQEILGNDTFQQEYTYEDYGKPSIERDLVMLTDNMGSPVSNFREAQQSLQGQTRDYTYFMNPLSEFTAFSTQALPYRWQIGNNPNKANYWKNRDDGRRFLKAVTKGTYRNFQELDPEFRTNYPAANQAFLDRIGQLRNYKKYPTQQEYLEKRGNTMEPGYIPKYSIRYNQTANPITQQISPTPDYAVSVPSSVEYKNEPEVDPETYYTNPTSYSDDEEYFQRGPGWMNKYLPSPQSSPE